MTAVSEQNFKGFPSSRLKTLGIDFPFLIAPMVGISHVAFRELVRSYLPESVSPLLFTEMLSTLRLPYEKWEDLPGPLNSLGENYFIPQLLGNEESYISGSIEKLLPLHPWGFDINMGCPASHQLSHNWGVRLLGDIDYASQVVKVTKKHSPVPVSVKLRAATGSSIDLNYLLKFTQRLEDSGADWLTLHCRTQNQGHHGYAHWDLVSEVAKERKIPVVANGDIHHWEDAFHLMDQYRVDGAMIARAATARPWILWQLAQKMGNFDLPKARWETSPPWTAEEEGAEYFRAVLRFSCLLEDYFGDTPFALKKLIFFVAHGSRWLLFGHQFFHGVKRCQNLVQVRDFVNEYSDKNPQPLGKTARI
ncbi:MAG: tRNA-dihydrouridine synthase family protein [Deltaproteobacteria bacterium]